MVIPRNVTPLSTQQSPRSAAMGINAVIIGGGTPSDAAKS
jgi:hypothetical protein